jgi:hypothetical protein
VKSRSIIVYDGVDPIEAEMLADILDQNGIEPRLLGTRNAALLGAGQHIFRLRIEVDEDDAAEAQEVVAALLQFQQSEESVDSDDIKPSVDETPFKPKRLLAAGAACVVPGGSHYYLRQPWTAAPLTAAFIIGLVVVLSSESASWGALLVGSAILSDLVAGQLALGGVRIGKTRTTVRQLVFGLTAASVAFLLAFGGLAWLETLPPPPRAAPPEHILIEEFPMPFVDDTWIFHFMEPDASTNQGVDVGSPFVLTPGLEQGHGQHEAGP